MNQRIPQETIEEIRRSVDILDVIGEYVQLKKQGRNYIGLCPFHGENTPSFSVSPDKQLYHCFGCGAGGNAFTFLEQIEGFTFVEAVETLAKRANVVLPERVSPSVKQNRDEELLISIQEFAAKFFHHVLMLTEEGKAGRTYLERRGFTKEQIEHFQIGFAPPHWDALTNVLAKRDVDLKKAGESGLLVERESDGKRYDRFRNRVIFPIRNGKGKIVAFGGRTLGDDKPKYLNSPESPIFQKGKLLYGFYQARPAIRKENEAVLFEGYVDVIAAWKAGVTNGVATLGTSLTEEQARMIRRNAETVIICNDGDAAGAEATFRSADLLQQEGCHVKVAMIPDGLDPDDYIQKYGAERFKKDVIGESLTLMKFKMKYFRMGRNLQNEGERILYIEEIIKEIAKLSKAVERDHYLRQLAEEFSLSLDALKQEQYRIYREMKRQNQVSQGKTNTVRQKKHDFEQKRLLPAYQNAERILLAHMMRNVSVAETVQERLGGRFNVDHYQAIVAHLFAYYAEGFEPDPSTFIQRLEDQELIRVATGLAMLEINEEINDQELNDYIEKIEMYPKWLELQQIESALKKETDPVLYATRKQELINMKKQLKL
ncbi:DNA primase [Halalkalibacterium halodurans]|uniref:DNA primase n=1 Tax=Halalkalibacterium halodurans TaxID=86665 RepID=A0A0M0KLX1_ALKHA|nr:DNA primase [Halalkalibacterium halodurans]TPE69112.1 DNA primase [Halalkalibacterium halodurans]